MEVKVGLGKKKKNKPQNFFYSDIFVYTGVNEK